MDFHTNQTHADRAQIIYYVRPKYHKLRLFSKPKVPFLSPLVPIFTDTLVISDLGTGGSTAQRPGVNRISSCENGVHYSAKCCQNT